MMDERDPTLASIDAYSTAASDYELAHSARRAAEAERFASSLQSGSTIIDAGCGPGRDLARFVAFGHRPIGIELNPVFAARARRHAEVVEGDLRDVRRLMAGRNVDGVWSDAGLVHLSKAAAIGVVGDLVSVLRPGGHLYVSVRTEGATGWVDEPDGRRWYSAWEPDEVAQEIDVAGCVVDEVVLGIYTQVWATRR
jgi:SAM-dependent methyltransferase